MFPVICCIVFWLVGWAFAFGDGNWFLGYSLWAGIGLPDEKLSEWFFQFTFASTASTILSGAVAERSSFVTYLLSCCLMSGLSVPHSTTSAVLEYPNTEYNFS